MSYLKDEALELVNRLHQENRLSSDEYSTIFDALDEIELLRDRDELLEDLWDRFGDVPMNPETECIEEAFLGWGPGIEREEIWHWFDKRHSKGVHYLLYGDEPEVDAEGTITIERVIGGKRVKTKLTHKEQKEAFEAQQLLYDLEAVQNEVQLFTEDYEERFGINKNPITEDEWLKMAHEFRRILDNDPDNVEGGCRCDAVTKVLSERKEKE